MKTVEFVEPYLEKIDKSGYFFVEESALIELLADEVLFANGRRYLCLDDTAKPETVVLFVNCNDLFAWACADAEPLPFGEIEPLYKRWKAEGAVGVEKWCCVRRQQRPQACVEKEWRAAGKWDAEMEAIATIATPVADPPEP